MQMPINIVLVYKPRQMVQLLLLCLEMSQARAFKCLLTRHCAEHSERANWGFVASNVAPNDCFTAQLSTPGVA